MNPATTDVIVQQVQNVLDVYRREHPGSDAIARRYNSASVRVRIIDSAFAGMTRDERDDLVWTYLDALSDDAVAEITMLVLVTPEEAPHSLSNIEFDNPSPTFL